MKGALIALLIGIVLLVLLFLMLDIHIRKSAIDLHLHDTYFVFNYAFLIIFAILFLGTLFAIGGVISSHLKSKMFWLLLVLFILIDTYFILKLFWNSR